MFQNLFKPHIRRFVLQSAPWLIVAVVGLIFAFGSSYSAYQVWSYQPLSLVPDNPLIPASTATSSGIKKNTVEISGAVLSPGVYEVSDGSRWQEVLLMANGFSESVDRRYVHQELNLAEKVKDQGKLYIPFASDSARLSVATSTESPSEVSNTLYVNEAKAEIWDAIEGIGEVRVKSILAGQPYTDKNDFISRSGISQDIYKNIEQKYILIEY